VDVHLLDGTYELFRHHFALPDRTDADGVEIAAARGVVQTVLTMLEEGATHLAVATDHTVESFRNDRYSGYKTGEGIDPDLFGQFPIVEDALEALGVTVFPMDEYEADDGIASGARVARADRRVGRVFLCTPDKDLAQCVEGSRVVQLDRRKGELRDADGVRAKFGVDPASIPDWLGLTGDAADGFPGLPGWGAKSSATVLAHYQHLDRIPFDPTEWSVAVRGATRLAATLQDSRTVWSKALRRSTKTTAALVPVAAASWRCATFCSGARAGRRPALPLSCCCGRALSAAQALGLAQRRRRPSQGGR